LKEYKFNLIFPQKQFGACDLFTKNPKFQLKITVLILTKVYRLTNFTFEFENNTTQSEIALREIK
jgi:hypothetical protein